MPVVCTDWHNEKYLHFWSIIFEVNSIKLIFKGGKWFWKENVPLTSHITDFLQNTYNEGESWLQKIGKFQISKFLRREKNIL